MFTLCVRAGFYFFSGFVVFVIAGRGYEAAAPLIFPAGCAAVLWSLTNVAVSYKVGFDRAAFAIPLSLAAVAEIAALARFHGTAWEIIEVLLISNAVALIVCLFGILKASRAAETSAAVALSEIGSNIT